MKNADPVYLTLVFWQMLLYVWINRDFTLRGHLVSNESEKMNLFRILHYRVQYSEKLYVHLKTSTALIDITHDFQNNWMNPFQLWWWKDIRRGEAIFLCICNCRWGGCTCMWKITTFIFSLVCYLWQLFTGIIYQISNVTEKSSAFFLSSNACNVHNVTGVADRWQIKKKLNH